MGWIQVPSESNKLQLFSSGCRATPSALRLCSLWGLGVGVGEGGGCVVTAVHVRVRDHAIVGITREETDTDAVEEAKGGCSSWGFRVDAGRTVGLRRVLHASPVVGSREDTFTMQWAPHLGRW